MAKAPRRRLTRQQQKLARLRVKFPDATLSELGRKADYDNPANVKRALDREHVQQRVRDLMDASPKLRVPSLLKKIEEGLEANVVQYFADKGKVRDKRVDRDLVTRHRYLDTALHLHGLKEKKIDVTSNGATIKGLLLDDDAKEA